MAAFKVSFSIRKKIKGKIAFTSINFFHVQIQQIATRPTTKRAFAFLTKFAGFYYQKIFETRSQ